MILNKLKYELTHDLLVINIIPGLFLEIDLHLNVYILDECSEAHRLILGYPHELFRIIEIIIGLTLQDLDYR